MLKDTQRLTVATTETALVILGEWNARSRVPVAICKPDGQRLFRDALAVALRLEAVERTLRRMAEYECNFPMSEAETKRADRRADKLAIEVQELLNPWSMSAKIGGDVRGSLAYAAWAAGVDTARDPKP